MKLKLSLSLLLLSTACGVSERQVSGRLDLAAFGRTQATLVAVRDDGATRTVDVRRDGRFEVALETGRSHTIAFQDDTHGRRSTFANLIMRGRSGRSAVFRCEEGEPIELGEVRPERGDTRGGTCRGAPAPTGTAPGASDVPALFQSALVSGSTVAEDLDDDGDHSGDSLHDADDDGRPDVVDDDSDDDGLCNDDDDHEGVEHDDDAGHDEDDEEDEGAELPYSVRLEVGDSFTLNQAFLSKGPAPASITSIEMDGSDWRLRELRAGTPFTVTQADCEHRGNRGTGRDRIFVAWVNADGSRELDHLDLRYCQ